MPNSHRDRPGHGTRRRPRRHAPPAPRVARSSRVVAGDVPAGAGAVGRSQSGSRWHVLCWGATTVLSLMLLAAIQGVFGDLLKMQGRAHAAEAELAALTAQHRVGRIRLGALESRKGREAVLLEHGYVRPGDRILLFPSQPEDPDHVSAGRNDLVRVPAGDVPETETVEPRPSLWRRGGRTLASWWRSVRGRP